MKPRSSGRLIVVAIATIFLLLVLSSRRPSASFGLLNHVSQSSIIDPSSHFDGTNNLVNNSNRSRTGDLATGNQKVIGGERQAKAISVLSTINDVPIQFYGLLVDQFGNAVEQAEVTGSILYDNGRTAGTRKINAVSDSRGFFRFEAGNGESLGVIPRKSGYLLASTNTAFKYSRFYPLERHVPDELNPVVIKMWKIQGAEDLVAIDKKFKLPFPEKPLRFDLVAGKIVDSGGDLEISCFRSPGVLSKRTPGDWRITIEAVDGGVIEVENATYRTTFQAPIDGYIGKFDIRMDAANPAWYDNIQRVLFAKSRRDEVFSKFYFSFHLNESPEGVVTVAFRGIANAHGSRNWEEDSEKIKLPNP